MTNTIRPVDSADIASQQTTNALLNAMPEAVRRMHEWRGDAPDVVQYIPDQKIECDGAQLGIFRYNGECIVIYERNISSGIKIENSEIQKNCEISVFFLGKKMDVNVVNFLAIKRGDRGIQNPIIITRHFHETVKSQKGQVIGDNPYYDISHLEFLEFILKTAVKECDRFYNEEEQREVERHIKSIEMNRSDKNSETQKDPTLKNLVH